MSYVREEDGQVTCSSPTPKTWQTCQPPNFTSQGSNTKKSHTKERCRFHVRTDLSNSSIFLHLTVAAEGNLVRSEHEEVEETSLEEENGNNMWSTSGDFIFRFDTTRHNDQTCTSRVKTHSLFHVCRREEAVANKRRQRLEAHAER